MIKINKGIISKLEPCSDRFDNYLHHYSTFDGTLEEFLTLNKITYGDKIWVSVRLLNKNQLAHFAILCAQSVQHIFEEKYPENKSVENLLNYLSEIKDFNNLTDEQKREITRLRDAAYAAAYAAAAYAADAYAAADAAIAAVYATYAATYAAAAAANTAAYSAANATYAANAAVYAATVYAANKKQQEELNLTFLTICSEL